jgi:hypothetical protein
MEMKLFAGVRKAVPAVVMAMNVKVYVRDERGRKTQSNQCAVH